MLRHLALEIVGDHSAQPVGTIGARRAEGRRKPERRAAVRVCGLGCHRVELSAEV